MVKLDKVQKTQHYCATKAIIYITYCYTKKNITDPHTRTASRSANDIPYIHTYSTKAQHTTPESVVEPAFVLGPLAVLQGAGAVHLVVHPLPLVAAT